MNDTAIIIYFGLLTVALGIFFGLKMIAEAIRDKNRLTLNGEVKIVTKSDNTNSQNSSISS
jgi:hypothetical protein